MKNYVLGFAYNEDRSKVLLIEKTKPDWQRGCLNGIGGGIESGETPITAMLREAKEEADLPTAPWECFCVMSGEGWRVFCFYAICSAEIFDAHKTLTEERIWVCSAPDVSELNTISNIPWLVDMSMDCNHGKPAIMNVQYGVPREGHLDDGYICQFAEAEQANQIVEDPTPTKGSPINEEPGWNI